MADALETEVAPQVTDRKEALREAFDEVEAAQTAPQPERTSTEDRARDEKGKFTAKQDDDRFSPTYGKTKTVKENEADPLVDGAAVVEPPLWDRPPASWKKEYHEAWKTVGPREREYIHQREEQMRQGVEPLLPKAQLADQISKVAEPYMNTIRGMNIDLPTAVEGLMKADHNLRTLPAEQKIQYFASLARAYGIDLSGAQAAQATQGQVDPNFYALQSRFTDLNGKFETFMQQTQREKDETILAQINNFAKTAEYFEEARPTMIDLLNKGLATTVEEAYKKAIRLNDELFDRTQTATQAKSVLETRDTANRAAKAAKAAAVSVRSSTPGNQAPTKAQDRRSGLVEAFDNLSERL